MKEVLSVINTVVPPNRPKDTKARIDEESTEWCDNCCMPIEDCYCGGGIKKVPGMTPLKGASPQEIQPAYVAARRIRPTSTVTTNSSIDWGFWLGMGILAGAVVLCIFLLWSL